MHSGAAPLACVGVRTLCKTTPCVHAVGYMVHGYIYNGLRVMVRLAVPAKLHRLRLALGVSVVRPRHDERHGHGPVAVGVVIAAAPRYRVEQPLGAVRHAPSRNAEFSGNFKHT